MIKKNEKHSLAMSFHENSKRIKGSNDYDKKQTYKIYMSAKTTALDKISQYEIEQDSFLETLLSRKSTRAFTDSNINLADISKLLTLSFGLKSENDFTRTYASAGGRYPIEVYIIIKRSDDLDKGIYHFNVKDNSLELIKKGDYSKEMNKFYRNQKDVIVTDYPCLILFSTVFDRTMQKYGEKGYRFILLDAGHMSQNLYMVATYLKLGVVALGTGADSDNTIDDLLGLISSNENLFYGFAVGHSCMGTEQSSIFTI